MTCEEPRVNFGQYALNKTQFERVREGKRTGKIEQALVVATRFNGANKSEYVAAAEADDLYKRVLEIQPPRSGKLGPFWAVNEFDFDQDAPF